ncbi:hypothetical protein [Tardiphaga sp.]|uniref:hypothetical protein n=1 Tax=Tardiphaga sp. TaxID=1926292 RepID=UPI002606E6FD|nr:hypothetical protein [Tardiphaga sp.]MDB5617447.1 hypothetical protein [Tardiphaga sp.]
MRQITNAQFEEITNTIFALKMIASVVTDAADEMTRPDEGEDWEIPARMGERIAHFAMEQLNAVYDLEELVKAAVAVSE